MNIEYLKILVLLLMLIKFTWSLILVIASFIAPLQVEKLRIKRWRRNITHSQIVINDLENGTSSEKLMIWIAQIVQVIFYVVALKIILQLL